MKFILIFWFFIFNIIVLSAQTPDKVKIEGSFQDKSLSLALLQLEIDHRLQFEYDETLVEGCLLYTSPSPRDKRQSRMPSSA